MKDMTDDRWQKTKDKRQKKRQKKDKKKTKKQDRGQSKMEPRLLKCYTNIVLLLLSAWIGILNLLERCKTIDVLAQKY